jgi:hypothetical protein
MIGDAISLLSLEKFLAEARREGGSGCAGDGANWVYRIFYHAKQEMLARENQCGHSDKGAPEARQAAVCGPASSDAYAQS